MKGIVLAGGAGSRLDPITRVASKQLQPVYDKPMIYYPLATLMQAGIREILLISTPHDMPRFQSLLGDGLTWGIEISYEIQQEPKGIAQAFLVGSEFVGREPVTLILGDNIFYGWGLGEQLQRYQDPDGAVVFGLWVPDPERYGVIEFGPDGSVVALHEKPAVAPSSFMVPGLYFYDDTVVERARSLVPSERGEIEITDLNAGYLAEGRLEVSRLPFATDWFDVGTFDAMLDAQTWVAGLQRRKGLLIGSPEAAAFREGLIDEAQLHRLAEAADDGGDLSKSGYAERLLRILELDEERSS